MPQLEILGIAFHYPSPNREARGNCFAKANSRTTVSILRNLFSDAGLGSRRQRLLEALLPCMTTPLLATLPSPVL